MQGLVLLNKPEGITSFGAVARIKRISGEKRVGHTGTLDPMATGVLPILLGRATALSSYLLDADKRYTARIRLGVETDTCDITGEVLKTCEVHITAEKLKCTLKEFTGKINQKPPMFSALKKDGVRLYDLARQGKTVDIPERQIEIFEIKLLKELDENNEFEIETYVSKGTYIRSLARDIGAALGCGATLCSLMRTETCGIPIEKCVDLEKLEEDFMQHLLPADAAVSHFGEVYVTNKQAVRFSNGGQLELKRLKETDFKDGEILRVKFGDLFLGLGVVNETTGLLDIKCVIADKEAVKEAASEVQG